MFGDIRGEVRFFETAMNLRVQRQQIIASNIANADTPQYKAKDIDFNQALQSAIYGKQDNDVTLAKTSSRHIDGAGGSGTGVLKFRTEKQSAVDGNTVDMDTERAAMAENSIQYEVLTKLISDRFSGIRAAIASNQG
jgi:flagellar basal-body rod protein FlgB